MERNEFSVKIVIGDEIWAHYWSPESKEESKVRKTAEEKAPKKRKKFFILGKS